MPEDAFSPEEKQIFRDQTEFLLLAMPELASVRENWRTWETFGRGMAAQMERDWGLRSRDGALWLQAKQKVHAAMTGNDPAHASIRSRIVKSPAISGIMLADLSMWLAGDMKISLSVTKRLVAVMLLGVSGSRGDWNALGQ